MRREQYVSLFDMAMCLSAAVDLVSPQLQDHHSRVAYIAGSIAENLGLSLKDRNDLMLAGVLHDIGALSLQERLDLLHFDTMNVHSHAEIGFILLRDMEPLADAARLVRHHHAPWGGGGGLQLEGRQVARDSHILSLADGVAMRLGGQREILGQVERIRSQILEWSGSTLAPEAVEAFKDLATRESFWLDATAPSLGAVLGKGSPHVAMIMDLQGLTQFAKLARKVIDFRSHVTATHSSGVAASAEAFARFGGLSERECQMMLVAGYVHDLGKLAVPKEILEKPARLSEDERNVIKTHSYHTFRILDTIDELATINTWASLHHERLDGRGYPFKLGAADIPLGSRIMAVADVFTAITEDRTYRKGMTRETTLRTLEQMVEDGGLDPNVVSLLRLHYDEVSAARISAQESATEEYQDFSRQRG